MRLETEYAMMQGEPGKDGVNGKDGQMLYALCDTESETQEKTAALVDGILTLVAGTSVAVKFTHANTISGPMLNIAGTGAKDMYIQGVRDVYWSAGATVTFTFDGTNWRVASEPVYGPTATIGNAAGYNVYVDGTSVTVRQGEEVLAVFKGEKIELGNAAKRAEIYLGDYLQIGAYAHNDDGVAGYIKGEAIRISTKTPDESGQNSVPSIIVNGEDVFINKTGFTEFSENCAMTGQAELLWSGTLTKGKSVTLPNANWKKYNLFKARTSDGITMMVGARYVNPSGDDSIRFVGGYDDGSNSYVFKANTTISDSNSFKNVACSLHKYLTSSSGSGMSKALDLKELWGII